MLGQNDVQADPWFRTVRPCRNPRVRLVCFPHAGGSANFFRPWAELMPAGVELLAVRYPGREDRLIEPFAKTMNELVDPVVRSCSRLLDTPLAFFGHSMGASVAYEAALRLQAEHGAPVSALLVSGRSGPGREHVRPMSGASDLALFEDLARLGGTDSSTFDDPELRELVLSALRADYELVEGYTATQAGAGVNAPITAYYGTQDSELDADSVAAWAAVSGPEFSARPFDGGHFYLLDHARALVDDLLTRLGNFSENIPA
ncbi:thioesterase II family protein [Streptomyces sp. NPDC096136]|uniref:thioesterase II family protein n=1 Tax=Streptomyces sp. NPDC096136 TaxID=3366076 RepID=UPI0038013285